MTCPSPTGPVRPERTVWYADEAVEIRQCPTCGSTHSRVVGVAWLHDAVSAAGTFVQLRAALAAVGVTRRAA